MIHTIGDINLESLKKNHARLYYFGLGFIQLKINELERLHFYSPKLPAITEDPHNHRYGFLSRILKGKLTNHLFSIADIEDPCKAPYVLVNETCNPDIKAPSKKTYVEMSENRIETYEAGQSYVMTPSMYHRVEAQDCITYLVRTHYTSECASVALFRGKDPVCPFSKKIPEEELWSIMKEMVKT